MKIGGRSNVEQTPVKVFVHIVTFNGARFILRCLKALLGQTGLPENSKLYIEVRDNASSDETLKLIEANFKGQVSVIQNMHNLGFCAAHNQGAKNFLDRDFDYLLILNPDIRLESNAIAEMVRALRSDNKAGMSTPRLYRADAELNPETPLRFDATGMYFDNSLRHFDRGSEEVDNGQYEEAGYVFGGTGAALMINKECLTDLIITDRDLDRRIMVVHPELLNGISERAMLFDEAFFAYREDAELAWRANWLGWRTRYVPTSIGYHLRRVLPKFRAALPDELNLYSVRNRFLMQIVNFSFAANRKSILPGLIFRNLLVILAVLTRERSSLPALSQVLKLWPRALKRRQIVMDQRKISCAEMQQRFEVKFIKA